MNARRSALCLLGVTLAGLLGGCISSAGIAPTATRLDARPTVATDDVFDAWPEDRWWQAFGQPALNDLVEHALAQHPDLTRAQARLVEARAAIDYVHANLLPALDLDLESTGQRYTENGLYPPALGGHHDIDSRFALDAVYQLDFFGRNRAAVAAATSQARAAAAAEQAVRVAIASEVARFYFELARLVAERDVLLATREQRERIVELVRARVRLGLDSNVELAQAEGAIPRLQGEIERVEENMSLLRSQLARLAVVDPASTATLTPRIDDRPAPTLPTRIPSGLLARRADVTAARWRIEAALAGAESIKAEFYPTVDLAAFAGLSSIGLSSLFETGAAIYGLAPRLHLPIFDGDRLRAKLSFASAEVDAAVADYNAQLLRALQDVVHALTSLRALERRQAAQAAAQAAAEQAYALALERYQAGLTGYLTVLATESEVLSEKRAGAALRARGLLLDVALSRALGGGFADEDLTLAAH
ncbi:MAG: efflux transporter outer membrane subunit [Gammaproteobacteria bacterium]|nr:efflux transporter outer membrane subunit [Gammaproteobacteria bacterium]